MAKELFNVLVTVDMDCTQRLMRLEKACMSALPSSEVVPFMWKLK